MVYAALIFEDEVLTRRDDREDYGEERLISLGLVDGECFVWSTPCEMVRLD